MLTFINKYGTKCYTPLYCWIMNKIDVRYWFCECEYSAPYGLVVMCERHD